MKVEYKKYIEDISGGIIKEALTITFRDLFQQMIDVCEDELTIVGVFTSLSEMLENVKVVGLENTLVENYCAYEVFNHVNPGIMDRMLAWLECVPERIGKDKIFDIFDSVITDIVLRATLEGITKGTISEEKVKEWMG